MRNGLQKAPVFRPEIQKQSDEREKLCRRKPRSVLKPVYKGVALRAERVAPLVKPPEHSIAAKICRTGDVMGQYRLGASLLTL